MELHCILLGLNRHKILTFQKSFRNLYFWRRRQLRSFDQKRMNVLGSIVHVCARSFRVRNIFIFFKFM